jgi:four helix bundle protein
VLPQRWPADSETSARTAWPRSSPTTCTANDLHREVARWPSFERWSLGLQLVRAADSIGANIAESSGRWHAPDKRRLLIIARGSLYETEHWMAQAEARGLLAKGSTQELEELTWALAGLVKKPAPR